MKRSMKITKKKILISLFKKRKHIKIRLKALHSFSLVENYRIIHKIFNNKRFKISNLG
jgi:hypothetical protein